MKFLTRQEELILLAIFHLKGNSYLVRIREHLIENTGRDWSISSVYVPLDRLTKMELLGTSIGKPTARRGGKAIKYYVITEHGILILKKTPKPAGLSIILWNHSFRLRLLILIHLR